MLKLELANLLMPKRFISSIIKLSKGNLGIFTKYFYKTGKFLWKITKPVTAGVRVLLIKDNKVLLVKHTYQKHWYLPGGGIKKGETFEEAIRREFKEEMDGELGSLKLFGIYNNFFEYKNDHIVIFLCEDFSFKGKTDIEIEKFNTFELNSLPIDTAPGTKRRIDEYLDGKTNNFGKW